MVHLRHRFSSVYFLRQMFSFHDLRAIFWRSPYTRLVAAYSLAGFFLFAVGNITKMYKYFKRKREFFTERRQGSEEVL